MLLFESKWKIAMRKYFDKSYDYLRNYFRNIEFELLTFAADQYYKRGRVIIFEIVKAISKYYNNWRIFHLTATAYSKKLNYKHNFNFWKKMENFKVSDDKCILSFQSGITFEWWILIFCIFFYIHTYVFLNSLERTIFEIVIGLWN